MRFESSKDLFLLQELGVTFNFFPENSFKQYKFSKKGELAMIFFFSPKTDFLILKICEFKITAHSSK